MLTLWVGSRRLTAFNTIFRPCVCVPLRVAVVDTILDCLIITRVKIRVDRPTNVAENRVSTAAERVPESSTLTSSNQGIAMVQVSCRDLEPLDSAALRQDALQKAIGESGKHISPVHTS
jgi:hypothetical protein